MGEEGDDFVCGGVGFVECVGLIDVAGLVVGLGDFLAPFTMAVGDVVAFDI